MKSLSVFKELAFLDMTCRILGGGSGEIISPQQCSLSEGRFRDVCMVVVVGD